MGNLVLFAETPSAGGHGHRFLVADDFQPTETVLSAYLQAVTENISIGANFLAVRQNVAQHLDNGTLRHGNEVLILAGIDMANVGPMELVNAINTLNTFLTQLRHLVTFQIDWNQTTGGGLIIGRPELGVWLQEITKLSLPTAGWRQGPQHLNTESPSGRKELGKTTGRKELGKTTSGIKPKDANVFWILVLLPFLAVSLGNNIYLYLKEPPKLDPLIETNAIDTNYTAPSSHHTPSTLPVDTVSMVQESYSNKKNQALKKLDGYMETKSFDNGLKYAKDLYSNKDLYQFNSEQLAKIEDNKRIFDEEINRELKSDMIRYNQFQNSDYSEKDSFSLAYLNGSKKPMEKFVKAWREWANSAAEIEIKKISISEPLLFPNKILHSDLGSDPSKNNSCTIKFSVNNSELVFPNIKTNIDYEPKSETKKLDINNKMPATILVNITFPKGKALPLNGTLILTQKSDYTLDLLTIKNEQKGILKLRLSPQPALPNWSKDGQ